MLQPIALPLFSKICIHLYCAVGGVIWVDRGKPVETLDRGEDGDTWAVYILVHSSTTGRISGADRSARVTLWEGLNVKT